MAQTEWLPLFLPFSNVENGTLEAFADDHFPVNVVDCSKTWRIQSFKVANSAISPEHHSRELTVGATNNQQTLVE